MSAIRILAIAAMDEGRVIGKDNAVPWHLPEDLKRFSSLTTGHTVVMGRKTYASLPDRYRPLPERKNVVVTGNPQAIPDRTGIEIWDSPLAFFEACESGEETIPSDQIWIIGGEQVYRNTVRYWDELYLTVVKGRHEGDTFFPPFEKRMTLVDSQEHEAFSFQHYLGNHVAQRR